VLRWRRRGAPRSLLVSASPVQWKDPLLQPALREYAERKKAETLVARASS